MLSSAKRRNISPGSGLRPTTIGSQWSEDYQGPYSTQAIGGFTGKVTFVEVSTGFVMVFLVKSKSASEISSCIKKVAAFCRLHGHLMTSLRCDSATAELSNELKSFCVDVNGPGVQGVDIRPAGPEQQNQNPVERYIQSIDNQINSVMIDQDLLSPAWWGFATIAVCMMRNMVSNEMCPDSTPLFLLTRTVSDLSKSLYLPFGQLVVTTTLGSRKKMDFEPRNEIGIIVMPQNLYNGTYLVYLPQHGHQYVAPRFNVRPINLAPGSTVSLKDGHRILTSLDSNGRWHISNKHDQKPMMNDINRIADNMTFDSSAPLQWINTSSVNSSISANYDLAPSINGSQSDDSSEAQWANREFGRVEEVKLDDAKNSVSDSKNNRRISSREGKGQSKKYDDFLTLGAKLVYSTPSPDVESISTIVRQNTQVSINDNKQRNPSAKQALNGPDKAKWIESQEKEDKRLEDMDTFERLPGTVSEQLSSLPDGVKPLHIWPIFKIKDDGTYKTREVVMGNEEEPFGDQYAPTVSKVVVWLIFAITVLQNLVTRSFDITGAFLYEKLERTVYVWWKKQVCRLKRSLYGLRDAPKIFNLGLVEHLLSGGYSQSIYEPCLFYKWNSLTSYIYIIIHVDDFNCAATNNALLDEFFKHLQSKYEATSNDNGTFLGILRTNLPDGSAIFTKPFIIRKLFDKYLPDGPFITPLPSVPITSEYIKNIGNPSPDCNVQQFLSLNGLLIQLIDVRPDIAFALSKISQKQKHPSERDYQALIYLTHYLWNKQNWGIHLQPNRSNQANTIIKLRGYADAAFAVHCEENGSGKSQYTECFDLIAEDDIDDAENSTGMFYFRSINPSTVDLCPAEAEMGATVETTKTAVMLKGLLQELKQTTTKAVEIYNDNQPNILLSTKLSGHSKRVRYMMPRLNWMLEKVNEQHIKLIYQSTDQLPADLGTKAHPPSEHAKKSIRVMGSQPI